MAAADEPTELALTRNPDILASLNIPGMLKVGFAAETDDLLANARSKMERKNLAMIIANDAVKTIGSETSAATLLTPFEEPEALPLMDKESLAATIIDRIADLAGRPDR
jgi:phosphopantothenoylcysteine decarboxylase/phosphopantothenate--cysteine ligase